MTRRLLFLLTVLSLLLCVAVAALWVRSYWRTDIIVASDQRFSVWSANGFVGHAWHGPPRGWSAYTYHYAYFVALLGLPAIVPRLWGWRRRRLIARLGHCRRCGYDLRATPDRSPECGAAATA